MVAERSKKKNASFIDGKLQCYMEWERVWTEVLTGSPKVTINLARCLKNRRFGGAKGDLRVLCVVIYQKGSVRGRHLGVMKSYSDSVRRKKDGEANPGWRG